MVWSQKEFDEFCEIYQEINLPFWCQTRVETVDENRFRKLKEIGCARIPLDWNTVTKNTGEKSLNAPCPIPLLPKI